MNEHHEASMQSAIAVMLRCLTALVRTRCPQPSPETSGSDEATSGWPDDCNKCDGVDDLACDEFIEFCSDHRVPLLQALGSDTGMRQLRLGISHLDPRVASTSLRLLIVMLQKAPASHCSSPLMTPSSQTD